ncbi:helix-turn-helix transcriptional regulator [Enterococcus faecalis]|uniref:helix-turn-helix domain-containing protein n=1 Tax=Enterococcus faecalis TaxID=1351 RepID=UPI002DBE2C63|nr:helix-turn-helix transcriptional regulator [Enterococcus faecalis]MEB7427753.1 helix-turn-helix transcriptional regulator [Enterococcus faecalis]
MYSLADRLRILREEKEWTKTYVAKELELNNLGTYANWEYGTREPDSKMIIKIANLYDVSTDFLLGRTPEKKQSISTAESSNAKLLHKLMSTINSREIKLLKNFELLNEEEATLVENLIDILLKKPKN